MDHSVTDFINKIDILTSKLPTQLRSVLEGFKHYTDSEKPVVNILATNKNILQEFKEHFPSDIEILWERHEFLTEEINDEEPKSYLERLKQQLIFSDYLLILSTALRISPSGLSTIIESLKFLQIKMYVFLCQFQQLPQKEEVVNRKLIEVTDIFKINDITSFACTSVQHPNLPILKSFEENLNLVNRSINESFKQTRSEQSIKLLNYINQAIMQEKSHQKGEYIQLKKNIQSERNLLRSSINSIEILAKSFVFEFTQQNEGIFEKVLNKLTWERIRAELITTEGDLPKKKFFIALHGAIKSAFIDELGKIKNAEGDTDLSAFECLVNQFQRILERDYNGLAEIPGIDFDILAGLKTALNKFLVFDRIRQKVTSLDNEFVNSLEEELTQIIALKCTDLKVKFLSYLRKNSSVPQEEFDEEWGNKEEDEANRGLTQQYFDIIDSVFEKEIEDMFSSLRDDLIEFSRNMKGRHQRVLTDEFEAYILEHSTEIEKIYKELNKKLDASISTWNII